MDQQQHQAAAERYIAQCARRITLAQLHACPGLDRLTLTDLLRAPGLPAPTERYASGAVWDRRHLLAWLRRCWPVVVENGTNGAAARP